MVSVGEVGAGGAGPSFAPRQRDVVLAAVGQPATLDCRVLRLGDKSVSFSRIIIARLLGTYLVSTRLETAVYVSYRYLLTRIICH